MNAGVLTVQPIIERLAAECPDLRDVAGAAAYARARISPIAYPSAFVIPLQERAKSNRYAGGEAIGQEVTGGFAVMIAARDLGPDRGLGGLTELETQRIAVRTALVGWRHPYAIGSCQLGVGRLVTSPSERGELVWQEDFTMKLNLEN